MKEFIYSTSGIILLTFIESLYKKGYSLTDINVILHTSLGRFHDELNPDDFDMILDTADILYCNIEANRGEYNMNEEPFTEYTY